MVARLLEPGGLHMAFYEPALTWIDSARQKLQRASSYHLALHTLPFLKATTNGRRPDSWTCIPYPWKCLECHAEKRILWWSWAPPVTLFCLLVDEDVAYQCLNFFALRLYWLIHFQRLRRASTCIYTHDGLYPRISWYLTISDSRSPCRIYISTAVDKTSSVLKLPVCKGHEKSNSLPTAAPTTTSPISPPPPERMPSQSRLLTPSPPLPFPFFPESLLKKAARSRASKSKAQPALPKRATPVSSKRGPPLRTNECLQAHSLRRGEESDSRTSN